MGVVGGIPPTARNLAAMVDNIPEAGGSHHWGVIGISREQWMLVAAALTLGGSIRVGLEDNLYLPDGDDGALQRRADRQGAADDRRRSGGARRPSREARAMLTCRREARARGPHRVSRAAGMSLPLEGIRVLDLSRLLPGGFCSLLLADFGAEVLKVEDTGMGDYIRWSPPYYEGAHDSAQARRCSCR